MNTKKIINDIEQWFEKNKASLENELLRCWDDDRYIIKGRAVSKKLKPYSLMVYPIDESSPTLADNRWEICCDIYPHQLYDNPDDYGYDDMIVDGCSKNGVVDAIIEAVKKLESQ